MSVEIEHKYLVADPIYRQMAKSVIEIRQGYLSRDPERTVRIRIAGDKGFITVKGLSDNDSRSEYEYSIPVNEATGLLKLCLPGIIEKKRYIVEYEGYIWEVDEFLGENAGLVIAEIELPDSKASYTVPPFATENVTGNPDYYNSCISSKK